MENSLEVLSSWKDIANYLRKGVRTVQRWEREIGLPVRRPQKNKQIVLAFRSEIAEWVSSQLALRGRPEVPPEVADQELTREQMRELVDRLNAEVKRLTDECESLRKLLDGACARAAQKSQRITSAPGPDLKN